MMDLWKSAAGMLRIELTSADLEEAFQMFNRNNIPLYEISRTDDLTTRFWILKNNYAKVVELCEKRGEKPVICGRKGVYWTGRRLLGRPVLLAGVVLLIVIGMMLPARVLFVRVEGNQTIPTNRILEAAEVCGIRFGASRKEVRSEKVKNALLWEIPELQWAGVNTAGCVAVISVREKEEETDIPERKRVSSIVAVRDGVISSFMVTRGNALCSVGQAVREGQILISGYTDCGIRIVATRSEGEIFAQTNREITALTPSEGTVKGEVQETARKISLLLGKKRINLWKDSGIWDATCGRMYEEYYITLPGGFQLPVALAVETFCLAEIRRSEIPQTTAENSLAHFAHRYLTCEMIAGTILSEDYSVTLENGVYRLEGTCVCTEMIGREQWEEIGDNYGQIS